MALTQNQVDVIKSFKNLFKRNDFTSFFKQIPQKERSAYAEFFYTAGIDLFEYLTDIPDYLFTGCSKIVGVSLPSTVKTIGESAFANCANLKSVSMENSVTSIGEQAFANCTSLSNVKLSNSLELIPRGCFSGDVSLSEIFLPDSVIQLRFGAFSGCDGITIRANYRSEPGNRLKIKQSDVDFYRKHIKFNHNAQQAQETTNESYSDTLGVVGSAAGTILGGIADGPLPIGDVAGGKLGHEVGKAVGGILDTVSQHKNNKAVRNSVQLQQEDLKESKSLKEAFSETMPDWLRARLLYTKPGEHPSVNKSKLANGRYKDYADQPGVHFTDKKRRDQSYFNLWQAMSNKGIDISNAKFIHDGLPKPKKDPRLEEPNIAFFYLDDGSVYGTGLNDNEIFVPEDKAFKAINLKTLMSHIKDFCWLDGSDPNNYMADKRVDRAAMNKELRDIPGYNRYKSLSDAGYSRWSGARLDKSGYVVDPRKFADKLRELGKKNLAKNLENLFYEIKYLQKQLAQVLMDYDFRNGKDKSDYEKTFGANRYHRSDSSLLLNELTDIMNRYNSACEYVDYAAQASDPESREYRLNQAADLVIRTKEMIKELKERGEEIFDVDIDWDTNESLKEDIENLEDVDVIIDPVMQDAKEQSKEVSDLIDKELDKIQKDLPKWDSEEVIGAEKQPLPDKIEEPKLILDENLFR